MRSLILPMICLSLSGCDLTKATGSTRSSSSSATASSALSITEIYPASGDRSSLPTELTIVFSKASLVAGSISGSVALAATYSLTCGSDAYDVSKAAYSSGSNVVTLTLPVLPNLASGVTCYVNVSSEVRDTDGNYVSGARSVAYTLLASSVWSPASSATNSSYSGGTGGSAFADTGSGNSVLSGIYLYTGASVNGIRGIWRNNFSYGASKSYGSAHGTASGTVTELECPAGMRLTGLRGTYSTYLYSVGIVCQNLEGTQTYASERVGATSSGYAFDINCGSGLFATNLLGRSGSYVDQVQLGCR